MQIRYREVKGGFECIHAPSIDLASLTVAPEGASASVGRMFIRQGSNVNSQDTSASSTMRRGVIRKASKLSFATVRRKEKGKEIEPSMAAPSTHVPSIPPSTVAKGEEKELPNRPSVSTTTGTIPPTTEESKLVSPSGGSSSFFNVPSPSAQPITDTETRAEETDNGQETAKGHSIDKGKAPSVRTQTTEGDATGQEVDVPADLEAEKTAVSEDPARQTAPISSVTPTREKFLPPIPRDFAGQPPASPSVKTTNTTATQQPANLDDLFEASGTNELIVRFEIMIVKVCVIYFSLWARLKLFVGTAVTASWYSIPPRCW